LKFTILSHAGLCVDHDGIRLVVDPWLIGSCYWRSWWNFPEPPADLISDLRPDYIYLTHLHWDHFHGATLRKLFRPDTAILVPRANTTRMLDDLAWLGFRNVTEIPHGTSIRLADDFTLFSYQFNLLSVDSAMIVTGGGRTIFDCNDCKYFGWPLRQITRAFPTIDFVLRSHSSATPIPYCIEGYQELFPEMRSQKNYIEEFSRFALHIRARYAIPFASNHCFLHRETRHFNHTAVSPEDVRTYYQKLAARIGVTSDCVVMSPGSSWSDSEGFHIEPFDYSERQQRIDLLTHSHGELLAAQYEKEDRENADFDAFNRYFQAFLRAIPWPIRKLIGTRVGFCIADGLGEHRWLIDIASARVAKVDALEDYPVIYTPALVLNDCARTRMFSAWTPSKRLRIRLPSREHLRAVVIFLFLLDLYELDMLPLRKNLSLRALGVRARRWRELAETGWMFVKHGLLRRPLDVAGMYSLPKAQIHTA
jgi:UDP-MurNAc hydroxylase